MAEVLSQSEIDALLAAVSSGNVQTQDQDNKSIDWIAYDLTSQEKFVRGKLAALQGIHERFARLLRISLGTMLKRGVTVNPTNTDFLRFGDYLTNILLPTSLNIVAMPQLKGHMIFVFSSKLTYAMVDAYYGGSERPFSKIGGRDQFTSIENTMIRKVCDLAVKDLHESWRLNYPMELQFVRSESNPQFVGSIHSSELVAVVTFEVEFENLSGPFILIIQLKALDPIQNLLAVNVTGEVSADENEWKDHWAQELMNLELDVRVELGSAYKSLKELSSLKPSDVIALTQDAASPLGLYIEGVRKLEGLMGTFRGANALRLTDAIPPRRR